MTISKNSASIYIAGHGADLDANLDANHAIEDVKKSFHEGLIHQIDLYESRYQLEQEQILPLRTQLTSEADPFSRKTLPGHITASGIVIHEKKILMIFHPFLKKWLQPGGHIECGEVPILAAQRELLEETGLHGELHVWHEQHFMPIDINVHLIPVNPHKREPEHLHYDFRYLFVSDQITRGEKESDHAVAWRNIGEIDEINLQGLISKLKSENVFVP